MRWIGKALLWAVGAFLVLAVAGALYQLIATEVDERRYPPPGELVDVGDYRLHVHCIGRAAQLSSWTIRVTGRRPNGRGYSPRSPT